MKVVLIGFMCSGKSHVGELLSRRLGWPHIDTDQIVSRRAGMTVSEIFKKKGEAAFRAMEREAVREASEADRCVVSVGGGAFLDPSNAQSLKKNSAVVWLKVSPETVLKRAGDVSTRPLIDSRDPLASLRTKLEARIPAYAAAPYSVSTDTLTPAQVADVILAQVPGLSS